MGVAKLKKAELYYHKSVHDQIAATLQESGACQIISTEENKVQRPSDIEALISRNDDKLSEVRYLSRTLTPVYVDPVPALDRMLGERPDVTMSELEELASKTDLQSICEQTRAVEHEAGEVRSKLSEARTNTALLADLKFFPYPLSVFTEGTRTLTALAGTIKAENVAGFKAALGDLSKYVADTEVVVAPFDEKDKAQSVYVAVIYSRSIESEIREVCAKHGLSFVEVPASFAGTPEEEQEKFAASITQLEKKESELADKLSALAQENIPAVQKLSDYYNSLSSRYNEMARSEETECTMLTKFWLPVDRAEEVKQKIEAISPDVALFMSDPAPEDEPPSLLKNGSLT
ncbi:MAG: hypothetical protein IJT58_01500, partial [Synergistaceae bacterium]|nr:hypothetical protein [Synergistaceae bacterium]